MGAVHGTCEVSRGACLSGTPGSSFLPPGTFAGNVVRPPVNTESSVFSPVALRLINQACWKNETLCLLERERDKLLSFSKPRPFRGNGRGY